MSGVLLWVIGVGMFYAGSKWGRARGRAEQVLRDARRHAWENDR